MNRSNDTIDRIREEVIKCKLCDLCTNRTNAVPGEGNSNATVMFIGEAPGRNEDEKGRPFVGMAGKILDECLQEHQYLEIVANLLREMGDFIFSRYIPQQ